MKEKNRLNELKRDARSRMVAASRYLTRKTLHSNAGVYRYLAGELSVRRARIASRVPANGGWENGYVLLGRIFPEATMAEIAADFDRLMQTDGAWIRRGKGNRVFKQAGIEVSRLLTETSTRMPSVMKLVDAPLKDAVSAYFGARCQFDTVSAWRNWHVPRDFADWDMLSDYWHQDSVRTDTVKVFVTLSDVGCEDGPLHFVGRADSRRSLRLHDYLRALADVPPGIEPSSVHRLTGPPGTAAIVNTMHCLHRAGIPAEDRQRDMIEIRFRPA